jgi:hypothetical protein
LEIGILEALLRACKERFGARLLVGEPLLFGADSQLASLLTAAERRAALLNC